MKKIFNLYVSLFWIIIFTTPLFSAAPVIIDENLLSQHIGRNLEYLIDIKANLTINEITAKAGTEKLRWNKSNKDYLTFGFTDHIYWVKFILKNSLNEEAEFFILEEYPLLDYLSFYFPEQNGDFIEIRTGDQLKFSQRPHNYRSFVFPIKLKAKSIITCYMKYKSSGLMNIMLKVLSLNELNTFVTKDAITIWVFLTILAVLALYNFLVYLFIKELSYFYYIIFTTASIIFLMSQSGTAFQYLWPNSIWWAHHAMPFLQGFICSIGIQFARHYFRTWVNYHPLWEKILKGVIVLGIMQAVSSFIINDYQLSITLGVYLSGISAFLHLILVLYSLLVKREKRAWQSLLFLLAWCIYVSGIILYVIKVITAQTITPTNTYFLQALIIFQALLLSLDIGDKIKLLNKELQALNMDLEEMKSCKFVLTPTIKEKMRAAIAYIKENYTADISREGLAAMINLNHDNLGRYFKMHTGLTIRQYINMIRIDDAKEKLLHSDENIIDIAFSVGFESLRTFNREFLRILKTTPTRYRKHQNAKS